MPRERALTRNGLLAASEAELYAVEAGVRLYMHVLSVQNPAGGSTNTASVYLQPSGGTSRLIAQAELAAGERLELTDWMLGAGDALRASATNADQVVWTLSGSLESVDL
jgi:hypothetical protein